MASKGTLTAARRLKPAGHLAANIDRKTAALVRCSCGCEDQPDENFRCSIYDSSGADLIRACVPTPPTYCLSCETQSGQPDDTLCLGFGSRCVSLGLDGYACGRDCSADGSTCPPDSECAYFFIDGEEVHQCVPTSRVCSACLDLDGDGYGVGEGCPFEGADCDDSDPRINPGATERCDHVDWDCDGDTTNGFDLQSDAYHCGDCATSCYRSMMDGTCSEGTCEPGACEPGYYDLDGSYANGCEYHCVHEDLSITDVPDDFGRDTNCDGITGDVARAVFVSMSGDDANDGSLASPVRTVQRGIDIASALGRSQILVNEGNFNGSVTMVDGVSIYGGFAQDFRTRNVYTGGTNLRGTSGIAVQAPAVAEATVLSGLVIHAQPAQQGNSSIALAVEHAAEQLFQLENVTIYAARGGDGIRGADGANGDAGNTGGSTGSSSGASGGTNSCGDANVSGGGGGTSDNCSNGRSRSGSIGNGSAPGSPGNGGWSYCPTCTLAWHDPHVGGAGDNGDPGGTGDSGTAAPSATNASGVWNGFQFSGASGGDGNGGANGSGGGGAGSGGAAKAYPGGCGPGRAGGGGGGGGAGGCAGRGANGGTSGGGSFGVVLRGGELSLRNTAIYRANGGNGGGGGVGGNGGAGGAGGVGNTPDYTNSTVGHSGAGGRGGAGGHGGAGSGGAGGCGGPSIGIVLFNGAAATADEHELLVTGGMAGTPGSGGNGGRIGNTSDFAPHGAAGCQGANAEQVSY